MKSALLLLASAFPAMAATTILDLTSLTPNQANFSLTNTGQTFTTGTLGSDTLLSVIGLEGPQTGATIESLTIQIWTDTDNNHATWDPGTLLGTSINSASLAINTVSNFNFTGVTLADSTAYTLVFISDDADANSLIRFGLVGGGNLYSSGTLFNGGAVPFSNGFDASFSVTTVPEPSAAILGGLGLLGLIRRRRAK